MRNYGKIETAFWQNKKVRPLSDEEKLFLIYLYSCPHGNSVGCFILLDGYIAADLNWPVERVRELVSELVSKGFIRRDEDHNLIQITGWFGHNTIENDNVAKGALKTIKTLPDCEITRSLIKELQELGNKFINKFANELSNEYRNPEQEQEPNQSLSLNLSQSLARTQQEPDARRQKKVSFEKIDFDAAARCCCSLLGKRRLSDIDQQHLTSWLLVREFDEIKPILLDSMEKFMNSNQGKRPASLAYFAPRMRETIAQ